MSSEISEFTVSDSKGQDYHLAQHKGKVVLVVNVASKCGFTPQYEGLENLYKTYKEQGFVILGFPCNQFMNQEPGSEEDIQQFCSLNYGVSFPVLGKVEVNGPKTDGLFDYLKSEARGVLGSKSIKWNFTKFLVGRDGKVIARYAPKTEPQKISADIEKALKA